MDQAENVSDPSVYWASSVDVTSAYHATMKCPALAYSRHILSGPVEAAEQPQRGGVRRRRCKRCLP